MGDLNKFLICKKMFNIKLSKILLLGLCLCGALGFSQANITVSKAHPRYFEKNGATWIPISTNYLPIQNFEEAEKYFKHFAENESAVRRLGHCLSWMKYNQDLDVLVHSLGSKTTM